MHVISQKKSQHRLLCDRNARFWVQNREFAVSGVHLRRNIMWLCVVWAIWLMPCAQTHAQAESPHEGIEGLNGSAYFDFAFRDTPNIVASGHIEGALAQAESELDGDSTDDGQSSGTGLMGKNRSTIKKRQSFDRRRVRRIFASQISFSTVRMRFANRPKTSKPFCVPQGSRLGTKRRKQTSPYRSNGCERRAFLAR